MYPLLLGLPSSKYWTNGSTEFTFKYSFTLSCTTNTSSCTNWSLKSNGNFIVLTVELFIQIINSFFVIIQHKINSFILQILNQALAPPTLQLLYQLLQQIKFLQQLQQQQLYFTQHGGKPGSPPLQLSVQITQAKQHIVNLQNQIAAQQALFLKQVCLQRFIVNLFCLMIQIFFQIGCL